MTSVVDVEFAQRTGRVEEIARRVAAAMSEGLYRDYTAEPAGPSFNGAVTLSGGVPLTISLQDYSHPDRSRLVIRPDYGDLREHLYTGTGGDTVPEITVAQGRSAADIAREIDRRLLGPADALYDRLAQRRQAARLRNNGLRQTAERLRAAGGRFLKVEEQTSGGVEVNNLRVTDRCRSHATGRGYSLEGGVYSDSVVLHRARFSVADFEAILQLLAERNAEAETHD